MCPFTEKQIELLTTFADQAVIAIENARLLNELRKSLQQQTATSEVLQVISSSPGDLQPVFEAMLAKAVRICDARFGNIFRWDGDALHLVAAHNTPPAFADARRRSPLAHRSDNCHAVAWWRPKRWCTLPILQERSPTLNAIRQSLKPSSLAGIRTFLVVPMLKDNELIGAFTIYRQEVRPFTDKQIELVHELRRPGRHRHREYAPAERTARIAAAAAGHRRRAQGHQAARRSIWRPCSTPSSHQRRGFAKPTRSDHTSTKGENFDCDCELWHASGVDRIHGAASYSGTDDPNVGRAFPERELIHIPDVRQTRNTLSTRSVLRGIRDAACCAAAA